MAGRLGRPPGWNRTGAGLQSPPGGFSWARGSFGKSQGKGEDHDGKTQNGNTKTNGSASEGAVGVDNVIEIAEELKTSLRDSLAKTNELIAGLRRHKKTTKTVQSALASLRQL